MTMRPAFIITAIVAFLCDQLSKYAVVYGLGLNKVGVIDVAPPYLTFRMAWNRGINFGLFAADSDAGRWVLIGLSLAICAWAVWWLNRERPGPAALISGGLLVGGALGNVVDRVVYGAVADFLNMSCCGMQNPYAFNVADAAIFAGAFGLILFSNRKKQA